MNGQDIADHRLVRARVVRADARDRAAIAAGDGDGLVTQGVDLVQAEQALDGDETVAVVVGLDGGEVRIGA